MTSSNPASSEATAGRRWLIPSLVIILGAGAVILAVAALTTTATPAGDGWMMGGNAGWGWMWGAGALMMAIPLFFLVLFLAVLLPPSHPIRTSGSAPSDPALELRMRYARGEITPDQYRQIQGDLRAEVVAR